MKLIYFIESESISCIFWPSFGGRDAQKDRKSLQVAASFDGRSQPPEMKLSFDVPNSNKSSHTPFNVHKKNLKREEPGSDYALVDHSDL